MEVYFILRTVMLISCAFQISTRNGLSEGYAIQEAIHFVIRELEIVVVI